jgi:hypothetical protein
MNNISAKITITNSRPTPKTTRVTCGVAPARLPSRSNVPPYIGHGYPAFRKNVSRSNDRVPCLFVVSPQHRCCIEDRAWLMAAFTSNAGWLVIQNVGSGESVSSRSERR